MWKIEFYLRIVISTIIVFFLLISKNTPSENANGIYIGFILADVTTWATFTIMDLPNYSREAILELISILVVAGVLNSFSKFTKPNGSEPEAIAFLVFMAIMSLKIGWYMLKKIDDDLTST
jgi:hypothetical protein